MALLRSKNVRRQREWNETWKKFWQLTEKSLNSGYWKTFHFLSLYAIIGTSTLLRYWENRRIKQTVLWERKEDVREDKTYHTHPVHIRQEQSQTYRYEITQDTMRLHWNVISQTLFGGVWTPYGHMFYQWSTLPWIPTGPTVQSLRVVQLYIKKLDMICDVICNI